MTKTWRLVDQFGSHTDGIDKSDTSGRNVAQRHKPTADVKASTARVVIEDVDARRPEISP